MTVSSGLSTFTVRWCHAFAEQWQTPHGKPHPCHWQGVVSLPTSFTLHTSIHQGTWPLKHGPSCPCCDSKPPMSVMCIPFTDTQTEPGPKLCSCASTPAVQCQRHTASEVHYVQLNWSLASWARPQHAWPKAQGIECGIKSQDPGCNKANSKWGATDQSSPHAWLHPTDM